MIKNYQKDHEVLYSSASRKIGEIHWHILKAKTELDKRIYKKEETREPGPIKLKNFKKFSEKTTKFGKEVLNNEIHWWIYQEETNIDELQSKTEFTFNSLDKLKEDAEILRNTDFPKTYKELICEIKNFTDNHESEIQNFYDYVIWLRSKNIMAPCILFSYEVWAATTLSDLTLKISKDIIEDDYEAVKKCTEFTLGLSTVWYGLVINESFSRLSAELYDMDPENFRGVYPKDEYKIINQTSREVLDGLTAYFNNIRESLRTILNEINSFHCETKPIVRNRTIGTLDKEIIKFCLVQLEFSIVPHNHLQ